jgi:hypothetical protein
MAAHAQDYCGAADLIASDTLPQLLGNTPLKLVKKMIHLSQEAAADPNKRALNYYLLGNSWYHCSYWGKMPWLFVSSRSNGESDALGFTPNLGVFSQQRSNSRTYSQVYYRCSRAVDYFRQSLANHPPPELAANAFYMLAECDRRSRWLDARIADREGGVQEGDVASPLFKEWAKRYGHTEAFRTCIGNCPGLKAYLGK